MSTNSSETLSDNPSTHSSTNSLVDSSKFLQLLRKGTNNTSILTLYGGDSLLSLNYVDRELECQICLSALEDPVLLACNSHSLCYSCIASLYKHQRKERDGFKHIHCPSCGIASGDLKVRRLEDLRINRELERVRNAYEREKNAWVDQKLKLEIQLNDAYQVLDEEKKKSRPAPKKSNKKGLNNDEQNCLLDIFENFGVEKLKGALSIVQRNLRAQEKTVETPKKKKGRQEIIDESEESDSDNESKKRKGSIGSGKKGSASKKKGIWSRYEKSKEPKGINIKRESTVNIEDTMKEYPLRSLKKTKTF
jgi:hypothetical protein